MYCAYGSKISMCLRYQISQNWYIGTIQSPSKSYPNFDWNWKTNSKNHMEYKALEKPKQLWNRTKLREQTTLF